MRIPFALSVACLLFLATLVVLPHFSAAGYDSVRHTTSELAAQGAPNAWMMRVVFIILAMASVLDGWPACKGYLFHRLVLAAFAVSLSGAAVWSHAPIDPSAAFDAGEDRLHSLFSGLAGFCFTMLAVASGFVAPGTKLRVLHVSVGVLATLLSILIFNVPQLAGVWQRLIFVGAFGWMLFVFSRPGWNPESAPSVTQ